MHNRQYRDYTNHADGTDGYNLLKSSVRLELWKLRALELIRIIPISSKEPLDSRNELCYYR